MIQPDTFRENQILYNGRIWRNINYMVENDQFLFTATFLPGSLAINGKTFVNRSIKYDIYNDEILTPIEAGKILQLNKEMVDSFSVSFQNRTYHFVRLPENSPEGLKGYVHVLYKGETALYIKYVKKIDRPSVEHKRDKFYQINRVYFVKDTKAHLINNKKDLLGVLKGNKVQIRDFVRMNRLRISKTKPESFIPVIRYCDSINL